MLGSTFVIVMLDDRLRRAERHTTGGRAMLQMMRRDDAIRIAELCVLAAQPEKISPFLRSCLSPDEVTAKLKAATPAASAAGDAAQPAATRAGSDTASIFGEPTPAERDRLAAVLQKRFESMYGPK